METVSQNSAEPELTQLAANEKQLLLARLLARLAHEIRNPLSSLAIHVQLLEEDVAQAGTPLQAQTAGRFGVIRGELHRLENLMRQFLSLAAPSAVNLEPVVVSEVIRYVVELLRPEAEARGIALALDLPDALPLLTADPAQLKQALVNLVINALQAVERGGRIVIGVRPNPAAGALDLQVSDNGPGVPKDRMAAIFEPFFTTKSEGSGLGLWIVQQIASAHGGAVTVAAPDGGGAVFTLRLPLDRSVHHG